MEEPLVAGRYRLLDLLGAGGEARVFRARDLQGGEDVAVRVPLAASGGMECARLPEFHAGWVKLLASGSDPNRGPYQIFELLEGATLQQMIQRVPLADDAWLDFIDQSLQAVGALHDAGWTHGDLNAENFLQVTASSRWKLLELPFLRFAPPQDRSAVFGSIHTLAPEQLQGHAADALSDLYALGCLYYYAAAGEFPHAGSTRQEIAISLLRFSPAPLGEKSPGRPNAIAEWVMRLLEREPARRCGSVAEARRLLDKIPR